MLLPLSGEKGSVPVEQTFDFPRANGLSIQLKFSRKQGALLSLLTFTPRQLRGTTITLRSYSVKCRAGYELSHFIFIGKQTCTAWGESG